MNHMSQMGCIVLIAGAVCSALTVSAFPEQNAKRVQEIAAMLRDDPGFPEMRIGNRAVWDALAKDANAAAVIRHAERIVAKPMPRLDDSVYTNQVEGIWGKISGLRGRTILPIAFAECLENRGRFLSALLERLDAIAAQSTWMNPYHDRPYFGNFYGKYCSIDLNVSEMALKVALVLDLLKGQIPETTVRALTDAAWRHCFDSYLRSAADFDQRAPRDCGNMLLNGWFFGESNWNPACHYQSVGGAIFMVRDRETRAKFIEAAERAMPYYLGGFSAEGYCQEGLDYWNYGFGQFLKLGLFVRLATGGEVDFFALEKARKCCLYAYEFQLSTGNAPQFGDGTASVPSKGCLSYCEQIWPETVSAATAGVTPTSYGLEFCLLTAFGRTVERPAGVGDYRLPIRTLFTDAQIYVGRPAESGERALSCCIKGGHNGVPHNHNDAGQYIIALGGTQMVQDPSGKKYDFDTFGPKRYNSPMLNSYGHAVPYPDGMLQGAGKERSAKILSTDFTDARDTIELDLRDAYTNGNIRTLTRRLTYDRAGATVEVRDHVVFGRPATYESPISTFGKVEKGAAEGTFVIVRETSAGVKRLAFAVDAGGTKWHVKEEKVPNPGRTEPTRFAIVLDEPVAEATVTFLFKPEGK